MSTDVEKAAVQHAGPGLATYVGVGILVFLFTALELLVVKTPALAGVQKPLLVTLFAVNFTLSALYYQGLQHDNVIYKLAFGIGAILGLIMGGSLIVLLPLGIIAK